MKYKIGQTFKSIATGEFADIIGFDENRINIEWRSKDYCGSISWSIENFDSKFILFEEETKKTYTEAATVDSPRFYFSQEIGEDDSKKPLIDHKTGDKRICCFCNQRNHEEVIEFRDNCVIFAHKSCFDNVLRRNELKNNDFPKFFSISQEIGEDDLKKFATQKMEIPSMIIEDPLDAAIKKLEFKAQDNVNSPPHYTQGGIETIDFIEAKLTREEIIGAYKFNVLKYGARANLKNGEEDLRKMNYYSNRLMKILEKK